MLPWVPLFLSNAVVCINIVADYFHPLILHLYPDDDAPIHRARNVRKWFEMALGISIQLSMPGMNLRRIPHCDPMLNYVTKCINRPCDTFQPLVESDDTCQACDEGRSEIRYRS